MQQAVERGGVTGHDAVSRTCKARKKVVSTIQCELQVTCVSMQYLSIRSEPCPPPMGEVTHPSCQTIHDPCIGDLRINCL